MANKDTLDFGSERMPRLFRKIFVPTLLGMLSEVAYMLTDGIFVGHGVGPEGLASVNLIAPAMMLITGIGMMFGMGASVVAAIHLAREEEHQARRRVTQAFGAAIALSLLAVTLLYCFPSGVMRLLGVSEQLMPLAGEYFYWFVPTCFFLMIQIVGSFVIRLDGSPRYSMMTTVVPSVLNIILDYTFIFPCGLGLKGAALATDIGTAVGALMVFYYMFLKARSLKFCRPTTAFRSSGTELLEIMKVGFAGLVMEFSASMLILCGNRSFGAYLGDTGVAAFSVVCYIFPIIANIFYASAASAQPIVSFNHGAGNPSRTFAALRCSIIVSVAFAVAAVICFTLFSPAIISIFLSGGSETWELASKGLPVFATGLIFMGFNTPVIGYFQSIERSGTSILLTLLRGFVLVALAFVFLPRLLGTTGLWLAVPAAEVLSAIVCGVMVWYTGVNGSCNSSRPNNS